MSSQNPKTLQNWIVGTRFQKCTSNKRGTKVRCNFVGADGLFQIVYPTKGGKSFKVNKRYSQVCTLDGNCTALTKRKVRVSGPVLVKR